MRSMLVGLVLVCGACARARGAGSEAAPPPVSSAESSRGDAGSADRRHPTGYSALDPSPVGLRSVAEPTDGEGRDVPAQARLLAGRGHAFIVGTAHSAGVLPVRALTWSVDARMALSAEDSVVFATPWIAVPRNGSAACRNRRGHPGARLVGVFRTRGDALELEGWLEETGQQSCLSGAAARAHVTAWLDDMELYARNVVRDAAELPERA